MKQQILIIVILQASFCFSQKNFGEILYGVNLNQKTFKKTDSLKNKSFDKTLKNQTEKIFTLSFNNEKSYFTQKEKMKNDAEKEIDLISIFASSGNYYYDNLKNTLLLQTEVLDKLFLIESKPNYQWILTQETKKIGVYQCYKATTTKKVVTRHGEIHERPVEAWYTMDIPIKVGVKDYHGLPGATVLLKERLVIFSMKKIRLNLPKINIKKPTRGKKVTQEELEIFMKENMYK